MRSTPRAAAFLGVLSLTGCDFGTAPTPPGEPATILLSSAQLELFETSVDTLDAVVQDGRGTVIDTLPGWTTDAPAVATISTAGAVSALAPGLATLTATAGAATASAQVLVLARAGFVVPMAGVMNEDWYLTNYLDHLTTTTGIRDHACGVKTYDGHRGTDLVLPNFAAMDAGVAVVAAAAGTVTATHDGEADRNKQWVSGAQWNFVEVDHGAGFVAWYGHLKKGSVGVSVGEEVEAGDTLGLVGSSGISDMPHLHFEVHHDGAVLDPFGGACGPRVGQWRAQIAYQDSLRTIDSGVTTDYLDPQLERVKDPPTRADTVTGGGTGIVYAWVQYHNMRAGSSTTWTLRRPDATVHTHYTAAHSTGYSMSWWWIGIPLETIDVAGSWTMEIAHEGAIVAEHGFEVATAPAGAAAAGPTGGRAELTMEGGGIR